MREATWCLVINHIEWSGRDGVVSVDIKTALDVRLHDAAAMVTHHDPAVMQLKPFIPS